jgi:hypothetical protein
MVNKKRAKKNSVLNNRRKQINIIIKKKEQEEKKSVMKRNIHLLMYIGYPTTNRFSIQKSIHDIYRFKKLKKKVDYMENNFIMVVCSSFLSRYF